MLGIISIYLISLSFIYGGNLNSRNLILYCSFISLGTDNSILSSFILNESFEKISSFLPSLGKNLGLLIGLS